jgi:hypothetical protein
MATCMACRRFWNILNMIARADRAPAEIDVFEPYRVKPLIQATQLAPDAPAEHQESAGWLFYIGWPIQILIEISIAAVDRIRGPQAVQAEQFENQRGRRGKATDGESGLRATRLIHELSGRKAIYTARFDQTVNRVEDNRVRIQQEDEVGIAARDALIDTRGESAVFRVGDDAHASALAHLSKCAVRRCIVYHDSRELRRHFSQCVETLPDNFLGISRHDYRGSSQK